MEAQEFVIALAVKDAEISMLRQQLSQLSADLSRNLASTTDKDAEAALAAEKVASLTALLAEKDALFAQFEEQVGALEALRQKEAAEVQTLQAALNSERQEHQLALQGQQAHREALEQQLQQVQEEWSAQLQAVRQAAATEAAQLNAQHQAQLEQAGAQHKQLQQQVQQLQAGVESKQSELGAVQMQLASALASGKRVQENHGKAMAAKSALVAQMQQELEQLKAGHASASRSHEGHSMQLIASINDMQELCNKQAAELRQCAEEHKALQQSLQAQQDASSQHEQARTKAEMRRSAMEGALQQEVACHAALKAQLGSLQECLSSLFTDLQQQHAGAQAAAARLSEQLAAAQEQVVCATRARCQQGSSPGLPQTTQALEAQWQSLSRDLSVAQERSAVLAAVVTQLHSHVMPLLAAPPTQQAASPAVSPFKAAAAATSSAAQSPIARDCLGALARSAQQQQQQQLGACGGLMPQQAACWSPQATLHSPCLQLEPVATSPAAAAATAWTPGPQFMHADSCCCQLCVTQPAQGKQETAAQQQLFSTPIKLQQQQQPWQAVEQQRGQACSPGWQHCSPHRPAPVPGAAAPPQGLSGVMGRLQAGVAQLQQQLGASQQHLLSGGLQHTHVQPERAPAAHIICSVQAAGGYGDQQQGQPPQHMPHMCSPQGLGSSPSRPQQCSPQQWQCDQRYQQCSPRQQQYSCGQTRAGSPLPHHSAPNKHSRNNKHQAQLQKSASSKHHAAAGRSQRRQQQHLEQHCSSTQWQQCDCQFDPTDAETDSGSSSSNCRPGGADSCSVSGSCSSEVAAAVAAAHRRMRAGQLPGFAASPSKRGRHAGRHNTNSAAGFELPRVSAASASVAAASRTPGKASSCGKHTRVQLGHCSRPPSATSLAALADATLKKLEQLSAEGFGD